MLQALFIALALAMVASASGGRHIKPFDGSGGPPQHSSTVSPNATPAPPDGSGGPPQKH